MDYPDTLSLRTLAVINESREKAQRKAFPRRSQLLDFCKQVLANLTPDFYGEVQAARLQGPRAVSHLDGLLDSLLLSNEYSEPILANLRQELKRSKEWAAFISELLRAEQQARGSPQASDEAGATEAPAAKAKTVKQPQGATEGRQRKAGRKPDDKITDRNSEIAALAASEKTPLEIAKHLDARQKYSVPDSWTVEETGVDGYVVGSFEKAYRIPHLRKKLNDLIYEAKNSRARPVG